MSDERELPERVWIDWKWAGKGMGTWEVPAEPYPNEFPYLRADKPDYYVIRNKSGAVVPEVHPEPPTDLMEGDTLHPVYIGPAMRGERR